MSLIALTCPSCGANLGGAATYKVAVCKHCGATVTAASGMVTRERFRRAKESLDLPRSGPRLIASGIPYRLTRKLGSGAISDVFLGERDQLIRERVTVKLPRLEKDAPVLEREWMTLRALTSVPLARSLPRPRRRGIGVLDDGTHVPYAMYGYPAGFEHTLVDVRRAYPRGISPPHAGWLWRRLLEVTAFMRESGYVHGAITPEHVLVNGREHGARLVGFSSALQGGDREADDIAIARVVSYVIGGDGDALPRGLAQPFARLLEDSLRGRGGRGALHAEVAAAAKAAFGEVPFIPLALP